MSKKMVGAHSCAMNSRLKAAPTITLSEREKLGFGWVRTSPQEVTAVLGVNWRITDKQIFFEITVMIIWPAVPHF